MLTSDSIRGRDRELLSQRSAGISHLAVRNRQALLILVVILAFSRAQLVLSQPSQFENPKGLREVLIRVPINSGSATAQGIQNSLGTRTIGKALGLASGEGITGRPVKILLALGVYHESCVISRNSASRLTLQTEVPGSVEITGADDWNDWSRLKSTSLWSHAWPNHFQQAPTPKGWESQTLQPIVLRQEMVFEGDRRLDQVLSLDGTLARVGSFFFDEYGSMLYVHSYASSKIPPSLRVATRPRLLAVQNCSHVAIRGIAFAGAASPIEQGAVEVSGASDVTFEQCRFSGNNWTGLVISDSNDISIRQCSLDDNGGSGVTVWRAKGLAVSQVGVRANNWLGAAGNLTGWAVARLKALRVHDGRFDHFQAIAILLAACGSIRIALMYSSPTAR